MAALQAGAGQMSVENRRDQHRDERRRVSRQEKQAAAPGAVVGKGPGPPCARGQELPFGGRLPVFAGQAREDIEHRGQPGLLPAQVAVYVIQAVPLVRKQVHVFVGYLPDRSVGSPPLTDREEAKPRRHLVLAATVRWSSEGTRPAQESALAHTELTDLHQVSLTHAVDSGPR